MVKNRKKPKRTGRPVEHIQLRLTIFFSVFIVFFAVIFARLWFLQVISGKAYARLAEENRLREIPLDSYRGSIYDRNGVLLVGNRPTLVVAASREVVSDKATVKKLSKLLALSEKEIVGKLTSKKASPFKSVIIKEGVDQKTVAFINEMQADFPGVEARAIPVREYPLGGLSAHVLGYLGEVSEEEIKEKEFEEVEIGEVVGKTGVERKYDHFLRGERGLLVVEVNAQGRPLRVIDRKDSVPGHSLILTIDSNLQRVVEESLAEAIERARQHDHPNASAGSIVVMDPQNGQILAMASYPTYDPRPFVGGLTGDLWASLTSKESNYPLFNRALMASYPPGSIFKPVTGLAGLAEGLISFSTLVNCQGRWEGMGSQWPKYCWKKEGHGHVGIGRALVDSCDVFFYETGYKLYKSGRDALQKWARRFGFGQRSGIDLPSEIEGRVPDRKWKKKWYKYSPENQVWLPGDEVNLSIGQGDLLVTPLQIANAYSAIANGGTLFQPQIVKSILSYNGKTAYSFKPIVKRKLEVNPEMLRAVRTSLRGVVLDGTARDAFAGFPVAVAGKTGTAEVKGKDDFAWFACYASAGEPQYVVVVLVEQGGHGGSTAAPAARKILSYLYGLPMEVPQPIDLSR